MPIPAEILLVDEQYFKKITQVNGSVDPNFIYSAMYIAQDKSVQPYLGDNLMTKLKNDSANNTLSGVYLTLAQNYVYKCVVWWTLVEVLPNLTYKVDNGTLSQRTSEDTTPVSDNVMKDIKTRAEANARYYTQRLVDYLCSESNLFPEYSNNSSPNRCPRKDVYGMMNYGFSHGNTAMNFRGAYYEDYLYGLPFLNVYIPN